MHKTASLLLPLFAIPYFLHAAPPVEFRDGDKVALLGNTFIEREQNYGHIETALALANQGKQITFRNFGWSGDTVFGHARSYFGPPAEGFGRLQKLAAQEKPTLILLYYGANASYEGEAGLSAFLDGYTKLVGMLKETTGARMVILSPVPQEKLPLPLPSPVKHNAELALYRDALRSFAEKQGLPFVDLFEALGSGKSPYLAQATQPLTDNGLHLTSYGYEQAVGAVLKAFGMQLPSCAIDDDELRAKIIAKNKLFFHMHRPQNETYLFGFRKHEQGNNASEIPEFQPLIQAKEKEIQDILASLSK